MISLSKAFRLCDIGEEAVYLRHIKSRKSIWNDGYYFWSKKVREMFDMKKIEVLKIAPVFEHFGCEFKGFCFVIDGISPEQLHEAYCDSCTK